MEEKKPDIPPLSLRAAMLLRKKLLNQLSKEESEELDQLIEKDAINQLLINIVARKYKEDQKPSN